MGMGRGMGGMGGMGGKGGMGGMGGMGGGGMGGGGMHPGSPSGDAKAPEKVDLVDSPRGAGSSPIPPFHPNAEQMYYDSFTNRYETY